MRLHNFFIDETIGDRKEITISDSGLISQWRHVLRLNTGSMVILFDNSGFEYEARFMELTYLKAVFIILEKRKNSFAPKTEVTLFQAIIKPDKFEWVLEKGTEIGVTHFQPILANRSVARKLNLTRARKILKESSEQSGRGILPTISETISLESVISNLPSENRSFVLDPSGVPIPDSLFLIHDSTSVFVGPEGGFTDRELSQFKEKKVPIYSIGTQILRAETASIAVASLLLL